MMTLALLGCPLDPPPESSGGPYTLCDGCGSWSSDTTPDTTETEPEPSNGALFRVRVTAGVEAKAWLGDRWDTLPGATLDALGDIDLDGLRDVSTRDWSHRVFRTRDPAGVQHAVIYADWVPLGDIDGDGVGELVLSAFPSPFVSILPGNLLAVGVAFVVDDGWPVDVADVAGAAGPDVDQDGLADTTWLSAGRVRIVSSATVDGALSLADPLADRPADGDAFGYGGTGPVGDLDGDGVDDLAVSELDPNVDGLRSGRLSFWSGAALAEGQWVSLGTVTTGLPETASLFAGFSVVPLGDLDGDGRGDLAIGWYPEDGTPVGRIVSGDPSGELSTLGRAIPAFGTGSARIDGWDIDGDGLAELLVHDDRAGVVFAGVDLASGADLPTWSYAGGTDSVLGGLDADGELVLWVLAPEDPPTNP